MVHFLNSQDGEPLEGQFCFNVLITSYELARKDKFLKDIQVLDKVL